jgi:putative ABC transport system substrate-binding protein
MSRIRRRRLLIATGALLATPLSSFAQSTQAVRRIGFLSPDTYAAPAGQQAREMFPASLQRFGYREGKNLIIDWRWGEAKFETLPALAEELVRQKVELIVARTNGPIEAAKRATRTIPIVMLNGNYPVETGLVESLARPGGNVTGTSYQSPETLEKQLQMLKETTSSAVRVAIPWNSSIPRNTGFGKIVVDSLERAGARLGMKLQYFEALRPEEISATLDRIAESHADALFFLGDALFRSRSDDIAAFALKHKLASVGAVPDFADRGGLLAYSPDAQDFFDRTASYVDRILKGAKAAELAIEQPTKFNLVINLKAAKVLGIKIPQSVLIRADRVIE